MLRRLRSPDPAETEDTTKHPRQAKILGGDAFTMEHETGFKPATLGASAITCLFWFLSTNQVFVSRCAYPDSCLPLPIQERLELRQGSLFWPVG